MDVIPGRVNGCLHALQGVFLYSSIVFSAACGDGNQVNQGESDQESMARADRVPDGQGKSFASCSELIYINGLCAIAYKIGASG